MNKIEIDVKELCRVVKPFGFTDKTKSLKVLLESEWQTIHYLLLTITTRTKIPDKDRLAMTCYLYNKKMNGGLPTGASEYEITPANPEPDDWFSDIILKPAKIEAWYEKIRPTTMERWRKAAEAVILIKGTWSRKYVRRLRKEFGSTK